MPFRISGGGKKTTALCGLAKWVASMTDWAVIYNPTSGHFRRERLDAAVAIWREQGIQTRLLPTESPGHATTLARETSGVERIVAHGGDGTLNEVANGLVGRPIPLAFLPGGTANAMAYELGLPRRADRAAPLLPALKPVSMFPGVVNGRAFMLMAGFGFDALAVYLVTGAVKSRLGALAYVANGLRALWWPKPEIRVVAKDGSELAGCWVVAARARRYGGMFHIHPRASLRSPNLGVVAVRKGMIAPFALSNMAFGTGFETKGMVLEEWSSFRVESDQPVHVHVDGDPLEKGTSFEVGLSDKPLLFCLPESMI